MKCAVYIIVALIVLYVLLAKFLQKPSLHAEVYFNRVILDKKIIYSIDYNGVNFSGDYLLGGAQDQGSKKGKYQLKTLHQGNVFGIELYENGKKVKDLSFDLAKQEMILDV